MNRYGYNSTVVAQRKQPTKEQLTQLLKDARRDIAMRYGRP